MSISWYFFGDTPQRGIYDEKNRATVYINSGALFIRDHFPETSDRVVSNHPPVVARDERQSLDLYKSFEAEIKGVINNDGTLEQLQAHGVNNVLRLHNSVLVKYDESRKSKKISETVDGEYKVVVVWTEHDKFESIPPEADLYVWIVVEKLPDPDFLKALRGDKIIIVQGDTLRSNGAKISKGISWEETALDTVWQYSQNKELRNKLRFARLVIVTFGFEGAVLLNPGKSLESVWYNELIFHQTKMEGDVQAEFSGLVPEAFEILVDRIIDRIRISRSTNLSAIEQITKNFDHVLSLQASTHIMGYNSKLNLNLYTGNLQEKNELLSCVSPTCFASVEIPEHNKAWSIPPDVAIFQGNQVYAASIKKLQQIINYGSVKADLNCPILRIGEFESVGRKEIESYSAIKILLRKYIGSPFQGRPLSIAVFGQPGSGKSFGIKEIAKSIIGNDASFLEFNLSQYGDPQLSSLYEVFHEIQDQVMNGKIPFVFFDEFDSQTLEWLKCFLMPMQDGEFIEHGRKRPLGKSIFVFAGGLYQSYAEFFNKIDQMGKAANERKLPDFLSRIKGYVDVTGVNPEVANDNSVSAESKKDPLYIVKRAMILSSLLKRYGRRTNQKVSLSDDVAKAFLYTESFKHGARSMEAILEMSRIPDSGKVEISDMPSKSQLKLHVDPADFYDLLCSRILWNEIVGRIARKYSQLNDCNWEKISSKEQNYYYEKAYRVIDYIFDDLRLRIGLCGDIGRIEYKSNDNIKLVLFSDHDQNKKIDDEKLNELILRSEHYLNDNGMCKINLPENTNELNDYMAVVRRAVMRTLAPFDVDPENTSLYLFEREST